MIPITMIINRGIASRILVILLLMACAAPAQQVVAPGNEPVGAPRGENYGDYNITNSFEFGYRWHTVGGDIGKYRSDVNYGNGLRLLGSNFTVNSKDGHGKYFDELLLTTLGLGNDPYQFSSLRIQKNRLYRYDLIWRQNDYFNPALTIAFGEHLMNTTRRFQDHSLTLFPQSKLKLFLGYGRNSQSGPGLSTEQIFDARGDEFPLFQNIRRLQDNYSIGTDVEAFGMKLSVLRGWEFFRDDTADSDNLLIPGNNPNDRVTLTSLQRSQPYHGSTNNWRVNLLAEKFRFITVNGRFTYAGGRRNFIYDENALGTDRSGLSRLRQTYIFGNARRPVLATNLTLTAFLNPKLSIVNHTAYYDSRIDGNSTFTEINNATQRTDLVNFQFLGIRTISNSTDLNYRATNWFGLFAGYQFSTRNIRSTELSGVPGSPDSFKAEQDNTLHTGIFGVRLRPAKPLSITLNAEIGRADRPFTPVSEKNYQALGARVQYKLRSILLSASTKTNYNTNSVDFSAHSFHSRTYSADASWAPREWFSFDAGYSKIHLDTTSGIAYFSQGDLVNGTSLYISNIHAANAGFRFTIKPRVDLYAGYTRVQDTGDGRNLPVTNGVYPFGSGDPFYLAQTFPLNFESPVVRVSVKLRAKLRWNVGYQFYHYREEFFNAQNYRAHTGYTSLSWSF
jgi:hypothetical protein